MHSKNNVKTLQPQADILKDLPRKTVQDLEKNMREADKKLKSM